MKESSKIFSFTFNNQQTDIKITKKPIKSLRLKIDQTGEISVSIPYFSSYQSAINFIEAKRTWIENNIKKISKRNEDSCSWQNGNSIIIWGIPRTLQIEESKVEDIELHDNFLILKLKKQDPDYAKKRFINWAKSYFFGHANDMFEVVYKNIFQKLKIAKPQLVTKPMKSMWGSCKYYKNIITLNLYLLKAPLECVNYVILHELAHTIYHNHGAEFKLFLTKYMPDWKQRKKQLSNYSLTFS